MSEEDPRYTFGVTVVRVIDGDTLDLDFRVGFLLRTIQRVRLYGINTPERGQAGWAEAGTFVRDWCAAHEEAPGTHLLLARTEKTESFGRWLADIWCHECDEDLVDALLAAGYPPYKRRSR